MPASGTTSSRCSDVLPRMLHYRTSCTAEVEQLQAAHRRRADAAGRHGTAGLFLPKAIGVDDDDEVNTLHDTSSLYAFGSLGQNECIAPCVLYWQLLRPRNIKLVSHYTPSSIKLSPKQSATWLIAKSSHTGSSHRRSAMLLHIQMLTLSQYTLIRIKPSPRLSAVGLAAKSSQTSNPPV